LVFVVIVLTTGVTTVEGAITGGIGFVVIQQLLTYAPIRFQGLTIVLFAIGALTYARHPEGILEYWKRKSTQQIQHLLFRSEDQGPQSNGRSGPDVDPPISPIDVVMAQLGTATFAGATDAPSELDHG
jgi:hypothetical protein